MVRVKHDAFASLNEGRDRSPGDTPAILNPEKLHLLRSTKAGTVVPATPATGTLQIRDNLVAAQRRPGP